MSSNPSVLLLRFKFDDFSSLPSGPGEEAVSERLTDSRGNDWEVALRPGGVSVYLQHYGTRDVFAAFSFILRDALGNEYHEHCKDAPQRFRAPVGLHGCVDFITRSEILDTNNNILAAGTLHIDVELRFKPEEKSIYIPPSSLANKMLRLLESKEDADASFKVGGDVITAHKAILRMNSQLLYDFCDENDNGSPIPINEMSSRIFLIVLRYIYGEEVPDAESIRESSREIIDAADRFGVIGLKLAVESALIESLAIRSENVVDWLVFADAKTCPLLKEYAMSYCAARSADLFGWESWKTLKESPDLMEELMKEISKISNKDDRFNKVSDISVNDLRKRLHWEELDIDGSKEMLVSRLKQAYKRQRTE